MKSKTFLIFGLLFIGKLSAAVYLHHLTVCKNPELALGRLALSSGDTFSYTGAMENYVTQGSYFFFNGKENIAAGRMPHYSVPYYLLRLLVDQSTAYDLLVLFQLLIECMTIVCLYLLMKELANMVAASILVIVFLLSSSWTLFSISASPESLSCSFLVLFIFFYVHYLRTQNKRQLVAAGLFLSLLVTLKPYFALVFLIVGIQFIISAWPLSVRRVKDITLQSFLVSFTLILLLFPWVVRNYNIDQRIVPFQINTTAGYDYSDSYFAFRRYVSAWGGDIIYWEKTSAGCYFFPAQATQCEFKFPADVITTHNGLNEINKVRNEFVALQSHYTDSLERTVTADFDRLTTDFINEKPFHYYFLAPLRLIKIFLIHSGSYFVPVHSSNPCYHSYQLPIKLFQSATYWFCLILGIPGLVLLGSRKNIVLPLLPWLIILLFPVYFRLVDPRYFRTVEPLLIFGMVYLLFVLVMKWRDYRKPTSPVG